MSTEKPDPLSTIWLIRFVRQKNSERLFLHVSLWSEPWILTVCLYLYGDQ